jgi:hypothetical protein
MSLTSIAEIQQAFIAEAAAAPTLFADLAKVELYISESYRARAFIELLQNADDAGARRFIIRLSGDKLFVANDGRPFTSDDIRALCRSGASNKRRGGDTIGYRGIGFKSVAGIATGVEVVSGEFAFCFSKALTHQAVSLDQDVPLIRIPHALDPADAGFIAADRLCSTEKANTVFVLSGLNNRMVMDEAASFDESALLFLNHIHEIEIDLPDIQRSLKRTTTPIDNGCTVERIGQDADKHPWLVASAPSGCEKVAFAMDGERIIPASRDISLIHAFMPTTEFTGGLFKINGDFTTDPSRKSIDLDEVSAATFDRCVTLLADMLRRAIEHNVYPGIFSPFASTTPMEGRFRKQLRDSLSSKLELEGFRLNGNATKPLSIRLPPDWLSFADYESLCRDIPHIHHKTLAAHPEFHEFLRWLGVRPLSLEEATQLMNATHIGAVGCAQVIRRAARQYRFDLTQERLATLASIKIIPVKGGNITAKAYSGEQLAPEFLELLTQSEELDDLRYLAKRLELPNDFLGVPSPKPSRSPIPEVSMPPMNSSTQISSKQPDSIFKTRPAIKQWRSAEKNTLEWFSALTDVVSVKDVSQANVGYDLEVLRRNGQRMYIEVKSVTRFGDPVRLTNNEHATAFQLGTAFLLAIVVNSEDDFYIRFVSDPIRKLQLDKRCEQWSWHCENYADQANNIGDE